MRTIDFSRPTVRLAVGFLPGLLAILLLVPPAASAAPTWLAPQDISPQGQNADDPQAAVDQDGNAIVAYRIASGGTYVIQARTRPAGGSWSAPVTVSAPGLEGRYPDVSIGGGIAVAAWEEVGPGPTRPTSVKAKAFQGGSWGAIVDLSPLGQIARTPQVSVNRNGIGEAVWTGFDGTNDVVQGRSFSSGWGPVTDISRKVKAIFEARVVVGDDLNTVVVWLEGSGRTIVFARNRPRLGGRWSRRAVLSGWRFGAAGSIAVAVGPRNTATAAWVFSDKLAFPPETWAQTRTLTRGAWGPATDHPSGNPQPGQQAFFPALAMDAAGDATLVWSDYIFGTYNVSVRSQSAGVWGPITNLSSRVALHGMLPRVAVSPAGDAVALWEGFDLTTRNWTVQADARAAQGAWGQPVNLSGAGANYTIHPQLAIDEEGNAVAAWYRREAGYQVAKAAAYDLAGPKLRNLSVPCYGQVGSPVSVSVLAADTWSSLASVSWDFGDGNSGSGGSAGNTYTRTGKYLVKVTAADAVGNTTTDSRTITIVPSGTQELPQCLVTS